MSHTTGNSQEFWSTGKYTWQKLCPVTHSQSQNETKIENENETRKNKISEYPVKINAED